MGGVERKFQSSLNVSERKVESSLRSSEDTVRSELSQAEAALARRLDRLMQVDLDLRNKRDSAYRPLWELGKQLSRYPPNPRFTYNDARALALKLKDWYFSDQGGMYLSQEAQLAYRRLQEELASVAENDGPGEMWVSAQADYERLYTAFSSLRTELTVDLQSRVRSPLDEEHQ
ncbi:hypothetical protein ACI780_20935 [Geodermatophilus sp. SYSU D00814]